MSGAKKSTAGGTAGAGDSGGAGGGGCVLVVKAVPNSPRNEVAGRVGEAWKIKIHAAPEAGKANKELVAFVSEKLGCPRGAVEVLTGAAAREKRLRVAGLALAEVEARLSAR
ncbi:MAG: DUF167 domain-containing protein [Puniceicoccales bacterium]|nr:DUF167 domain-containing protein [Puniceicoccales bacterium]